MPNIHTKYKTGRKEEALDVSPDIEELANLVLSQKEIDEVDEIALDLVSSKKRRDYARNRLVVKVGFTPKRPLFYAANEYRFLPNSTRDPIRYMGDYVDLLIKHLAFVLTGSKAIAKSSMGFALKKIENSRKPIDEKLLKILKSYNTTFYRPAKHDFNLPRGRKDHRFTSKEAVYTAYISKKLGTMIVKITKCDRELECHIWDST